MSLPETFELLGLHVQTRRVYDGEGRCYMTYRSQMNYRSVVIIWPETEGWRDKDHGHDNDVVTTPDLTDGASDLTDGANGVFATAMQSAPTPMRSH